MSEEIKWTPEPWTVHMLGGGKGGPNRYAVRGPGDDGSAGYGIAIFQPLDGSGKAGRNARRAAECVNAMQGIEDPAAIKRDHFAGKCIYEDWALKAEAELQDARAEVRSLRGSDVDRAHRDAIEFDAIRTEARRVAQGFWNSWMGCKAELAELRGVAAEMAKALEEIHSHWGHTPPEMSAGIARTAEAGLAAYRKLAGGGA